MTSVTGVDAGQDLLAEVQQQHRVECFLYEEAELLDNWDWPAWYALFDDSVRYWMPVRHNRLRRDRGADEVPDGIEMAHFDDDIRSLKLRVDQMASGRHWAEDPPSRTRHLVSNVRIRPLSSDSSDLAVRSNFLVYRNRLETEVDVWAGERRDVLSPTGDSFRIAARTILLDQNVLIAKNLSVFF
ncbi:MAG: 3-phenylpropionate/cinnamic acid dioxygenase subunit beta [Acidimicrobiia bacterium]